MVADELADVAGTVEHLGRLSPDTLAATARWVAQSGLPGADQLARTLLRFAGSQGEGGSSE